MRKYFLELFAIGLVDSEGRINTEHMTSDALMTAMKTMEELTQMKMDRLVLETTMEMILCMFESCDTEEFTEILGKPNIRHLCRHCTGRWYGFLRYLTSISIRWI